MEQVQGDDFQQQFMAQVRGQDASNSDPTSAPQPNALKKKIGTRWIIIIILVILLVSTAIVLGIISANTADDSEGDLAPYKKSVIGALWSCNEGTDMTFNSDGSYTWENLLEIPMVETGKFEQKDNKLSISPQSYTVEDSPADFDQSKYDLKMYYDENDFIIFYSEDKNMVRSCMRFE